MAQAVSPESTAKTAKYNVCCSNFICCLGGKANKFVTSSEIPEGGLVKNRGCTDICMVPIFAIMLAGLIVISVFGFIYGNPRTLIEPTDLEYNICGYDKGSGNNNKYDLRNYRYLWYPFDIKSTDITQNQILSAFSLGICVEKCPTAMFYSFNMSLSSVGNYGIVNKVGSWVCSYDYKHFELNETAGPVRAMQRDQCYPNLLPTMSVGRRCIPLVNNSTLNAASKALFDSVVFFSGTIQNGVGEVINSWPAILISAGLAFALCLFFIFFVRFLLGVLVYILLVLVLIGLGAGGIFFLYSAYTRYNLSTDGSEERKYAYVYLGFGAAFLLADVIYAFLLIWLIRRVKAAVAILQEATKALFAMPTLLIAPPITVVIVCALFVYWMVITTFLSSTTTPVTLDTSSIKSLAEYTSLNITGNYTVRKNDPVIQGMVWVNIFGFLWIMNLFFAISYMATAMSVVQWFFSARGKERKKTPLFILLRSIIKVVFYHLGTLILGSLIVAIVQFFRVVFRYLTERLKKVKTAAFISKIIEGLLWILEKIVKYINKNSYITCAIYGQNFCLSSQKAFTLIFKNILRVGATNGIALFLLILARIIITAICMVICYFIIDFSTRYNWGIVSNVNYAVLPTLLSGVICFLIAHNFMTVYSTCVETILLCFCADVEANREGTYYSPPSLQSVISKFEWKPKKETKETKEPAVENK